MVLYGEFVDAVSNGDVDWVADWLESLERPEDINEVDTEIPFRPHRDVEVVKARTCRICGRSDRASGCPGCHGAGPVFDKRTEHVHYAISLSPAYIGKSFEELRLEDYELGREAGKWWIGGTLQINNDRDMATALDVLQLGLPSDSDEETIPGMRSIEARLRVNNAGALVAMDVV